LKKETGMTKVTIDPELRAKLGSLQDLVEFRDESGRVVGFFHPIGPTTKTHQSSSPISDDQIEAARQQKTGRPLADIVADLDRQE
jgi:hypothetical protein